MKPLRDTLVLVALGALAACAQGESSDSSATPSKAISRYVQLNVGRVHLGEQLPDSVRAAATVVSGDTIVSLPRGSFTGVERITLHLNPDGVLRGAVFDYATRIDFEALLREYDSLGAPTRFQAQRRGEEPSDIVSWQDTRSTFRLRRDPNRSAWTVRVELWDRALSERVR
jgi:hypothetical protein